MWTEGSKSGGTDERILDYDGAPHNADTGARVAADNEPGGDWIDALPETSLEGVTLITKPSDMVSVNGEWMRRDECEARFGESEFLRDVRKAAAARDEDEDREPVEMKEAS